MTTAPLVPRRAWVVVAGGTIAYMFAVMQRSSLGVAGVAAAHRFEVSAAALSTLGVLQLVTYAALQIPVGLLVDRFGPKSVLVVGAVLMAAGQIVVALSMQLPMAVAGRVLVGAGDATTFISVLRLVNEWFPARRVPLISQWVGNLGGVGQVLSAVPFAALLAATGWRDAFLTAAAVAGIGLVVLVLLVIDGPTLATRVPPSARDVFGAMRRSLARPGTQLGFWSHFVTQSSGTMFALFWGYPFLVSAVGLPSAVAAGLLTVQTAAAVLIGPILGSLTGRFPLRRSNLVIGVVLVMGIVWTAVLLWPGTPPLALLVLLVAAIGIGGPGSQIGFDYARTFNPIRSLGSANGVVNVAGFTASFSMMLLIGLILDAQHAASIAAGHANPLYSLGAFRVAFSVQYLVIGGGMVMFVLARRRTRSMLVAEGAAPVGPFWTAVRRNWRDRDRG